MNGKGGRFPLGLEALKSLDSEPAMDNARAAPRRWPWAVAVCLLGSSITAALWPAGGVARSTRPNAMPSAHGLAPAPTPSPVLLAGTDDGPEGRLMAVYQLLAAGEIAQAQRLSDALASSHPTFALGQLLQADLLAARAGHVGALGSALAAAGTNAAAAGQAQRDLEPLQLEAQRRLDALRARPPEGTVPAELLVLPASVRTAIVVDISRSRLYLLGNGQDGLTLMRDYYVSVGQQGVDKRADGDQRTPLGVYWITSRLDARHIDARFGQGAMGINYPNAWDRSLGRGGRGLFVHGVPANTLARLPYATDGCIAMANDDLLELAGTAVPGQTPVLVARQLNWVAPQAAAQVAADFRAAYDLWDRARMAGDLAQVRTWHDKAAQIEQAVTLSQAPRQDLSLIAWNGDDQRTVVATSRQPGVGAGDADLPVRQYWVQRDGQWRILFEGRVPAVSTRGRPMGPTWIDAAAGGVAGGGTRRAVAQNATSGG